MPKLLTDTGLRFLWISAVVIALDLWSKYEIIGNMALSESVEIMPFFNFTYVRNYGAAFSFLHDASGWQRWFFTAIALVVSGYICVWLMRLKREQWLLSFALALVLGGALGNLWDRMYFGHVVDFISVHWGTSYFPTFNIADAGISVGACLLLLDMVLNPEPKKSA